MLSRVDGAFLHFIWLDVRARYNKSHNIGTYFIEILVTTYFIEKD